MSKKTNALKTSKFMKKMLRGPQVIVDDTPNEEGKTAQELFEEKSRKNLNDKLIHDAVFTESKVRLTVREIEIFCENRPEDKDRLMKEYGYAEAFEKR